MELRGLFLAVRAAHTRVSSHLLIYLHKKLSLPCLELHHLILSRVSQRHDVVEDSYWDADEGQIGQQGLKCNWFSHLITVMDYVGVKKRVWGKLSSEFSTNHAPELLFRVLCQLRGSYGTRERINCYWILFLHNLYRIHKFNTLLRAKRSSS